MKQKKTKTKYLLSLMLVLAMAITMLIGMTVTANAKCDGDNINASHNNELNCGMFPFFPNPVGNVENLIKDLPDDPAEADATAAQAAYGAYMALTDEQKAKLSEEAQKKIAAYKEYYETQYANQRAADEVSDLVAKLPYDPAKADLEEAQAAYDAYMKLTDAQKALLPEVIQQKVAAYKEFFETQYANKRAADEVSALVRALPDDPAEADPTAAQAAYGAYMLLTDAQKALLPEDVQQKVAAYKAYYEAQYADKKAADAVIALINKLPYNPAEADEADAWAAYGAYMLLTDAQKALLPEAIQQKVAAYKEFFEAQYADQKAVDAVIALINKLPYYPSQAKEEDAKAAFGAYMLLTDAQKALLGKDAQEKVAAYKFYYESQYAKARNTELKSVKAKKGKKAVVTWTAVSGVDGYQVYYKTKGKKAKKATVNNAKAVKKTIKKLKADKKYTVKVRTFTKVYNPETGKDKKVYSKWSNKKKVKAKK